MKNEDIVDISTKYGVASKFTSFVAIEERQEGEKAKKQADINELLSAEPLDELPCINYFYLFIFILCYH